MNGNKWILLAEDDANDADLAMRTLALADSEAEIVVTRDGAEALACLYHRGEFQHHQARENPVVVVLDLKMPRVDGLEVLTRIKADARLKRIPVVIFSSSREERDIARSYELGANAYVVKPVDFREYAAALKDVASFWTRTNEPPPNGVEKKPRQSAALWVAHKA
jgi:CheY-like chemotaxis protein